MTSGDDSHGDSGPQVTHVPGFGAGKPDEAWKRSLARNSGFYKYPHEFSEKDLSEAELNDKFERLIKADDPKSACTPLQLEEFRCLNKNGYHTDPEYASTKCVKWYHEWLQCKWDEEKLKFGYNYMEGRPQRKHKAYIAAPNYQYS
ncbi:conserved hypothetical protein [Theileria equi strain WA]|uniref:Uncharacterized protein n=1 Tax=Theileria equi strain WA TaxID=1537102 RepID=L1LDH5_THEEQ|nr:conserved hypothetical protein [Theileria equi strain WA]EKX73285.1 conserved hypothetical protein [Theileria equi strain WA]|eukprot:XP_004832737.1 conserved hypothetical protein [Theileria equi strain WA]